MVFCLHRCVEIIRNAIVKQLKSILQAIRANKLTPIEKVLKTYFGNILQFLGSACISRSKSALSNGATLSLTQPEIEDALSDSLDTHEYTALGSIAICMIDCIVDLINCEYRNFNDPIKIWWKGLENFEI